ncbi:MAG: GNAT family N-acetyltransferase [Verrucomicrobia bacterium]|jgi:acyl-CoA hydrolase/GNAT superfamily N-acetyltransferase|nr:GNAT family N-acetyltransferase [Verrucomicrobiota bacterium]MBT7066206.1 GNAT family N-acetyltransferase [Verrucomicrobiota bacterium]MBT7699307.1 GNAT family N-acetyltransferase [Verrucomicrobiota bacterium]
MTKEQTWDPDWQTTYADMTATLEEATKRVRPGQRVFVGTGCAHPQALVHALTARAAQLVDTEIIHFLGLGDAPYALKEMTENFRVNSLFISSNVRDVIQEGMGDYTPIFLSDIPRLFGSGQLPLDVALIQVSPPDANGQCSLGISVDIVKSAAENATLVIAQVNPRMPRTLGDSSIDVYDIDVLVPVDSELIEVPIPVPDENIRKIGLYVASLVSDGATIELGIGEIPQSVLEFLHDRKDLGIHTEMLTDAIIPLIEEGVITGKRKTLDRGRVVASFCVGTRTLYDYVDNNPTFAFHPTEYVNDPFIIGQQHKQVAINVALEIDLTGQVCADSLGNRFYSGIGGQVDFNRGAARSHGGKAIIALPSTAKGGTVSRISCCLQPGAGVVTTRGDVHYVVTEFGIAYLHGKSVMERAIALISIAHPDFRAELLKEAIEAKYVRPELADVGDKLVVGPPEFKTTYISNDGTQVNFRPIHPTDVPATKELFYALSQETIYYRFMSNARVIPHKQIQDFVFINHRADVAIVATMPAPQGDEIIAIGRYYLDDKTNRAEVAFVVRDDWQNQGIGTFLLRHLATIARRNGIGGFTAEVLRANRAMQHVFQKCDSKVTSTPHEDVISFKIEFA